MMGRLSLKLTERSVCSLAAWLRNFHVLKALRVRGFGSTLQAVKCIRRTAIQAET